MSHNPAQLYCNMKERSLVPGDGARWLAPDRRLGCITCTGKWLVLTQSVPDSSCFLFFVFHNKTCLRGIHMQPACHLSAHGGLETAVGELHRT